MQGFEDKFHSSSFDNQRKFLSIGENITFFGFQVGGSDGTILGNARGLHGREQHTVFAGKAYENVTVRIYILSPDGSRIFNREVLTDSNGSFDAITFSITPDLSQGLYEVYYEVKTPDGLIVPVGAGVYGGRDLFFVSALQRFEVNTSIDKTFEVYFRGIGMNASNLRFDQAKPCNWIYIEQKASITMLIPIAHFLHH